jgi:hypothetical protein
MRQIRYFLTAILFSGAAFMTSCSKSEDTTPVDQPPTLNLTGGAGFTSSDVTVTVNAAIKVGITAFSNTASNAKLARFTITRVYNNSPFTAYDTTLNTNAYNVNITSTAINVAGQEKWIFRVTDKNGQFKETSFIITTVASSGPINTFSMKIMGAQGSSTGSSFASIDGTVYSLANAKTNAAKIDWLYFYGATNLATLASPADADAALVFNDPTNGLATWAVKNNTKFKKVTTAVDWNSITTDEIIVAQTASGVTETKINHLAVNDVLSFIAASGKKGMIRVEAISGTTDGTITISVKVQQ